ncbi:MAG TPA: hypothetical protein PLW81_03850 [Thiobacillaceae bacterium]|nr:hypothetical protein [Thiobacillaceae bacterium]
MLSPPVLALLFASSLQAALLLAAAVFALGLLRRWDLASGHPAQIALERRTYLVATLVGLLLLLQPFTLALFVYNAERMAPLFSGAMCAVGTLNVNPWGFPDLYARLAVFFLAAAWLILNHLDNQGWDYPLVRRKYALLLALAPAALIEAGLAWAYFLNLKPDVITSCCGSLFGDSGDGVSSDLAALAPATAMGLFWGMLALTGLAGLHFLWRRRGGRLYGLLALAGFPVALAGVVAFLSLYIYEHPRHHCPFCLLQAEHGHAGWWLYPPLFLAATAGLGVALAAPQARHPSLAEAAPTLARRLTLWSLAGLALFAGLAGWYMGRSNLILMGG